MLAISDIDTSHSSNTQDFQRGEKFPQTGGKAKAAQFPPLEPTNEVEMLYLQRKITFGGGQRYGNVVAHLTLSNITTQLNKICREIHYLKGQKSTSGKSHEHIHKRLCELEFREMLLEAEHKVNELWPLQSAYLEKINSKLQHYSDEMNAALGFEGEDRLNKLRVPWIQAKLAWLRLAREEYRVKKSDTDLEIWPITPFSWETVGFSTYKPTTTITYTTQDTSPRPAARENEMLDRGPPKLKGILEKTTGPFATPVLTSEMSKWTKISNVLVNSEALEEAYERFEKRDDSCVILRELTTEEIRKLAERTQQIRDARRPRFLLPRKSGFKSRRMSSPPPPPPLDGSSQLSLDQRVDTKGSNGARAVAEFLEKLDGLSL